MNARVRELAEQAGIQIVKATNYATALAEQGQLKDLEKFAELIVRECATWIDEQPGWDGPYGHELLNFFGVEE